MTAYIIAEAGVNHGGRFTLAQDMVKVAAESGCDAIKFQVYDPDKLATAEAGAYWDRSLEPTSNQRDLFRAHAGLTRDNYIELAGLARLKGIHFICSVFHVEDVEWLAPLVSHFKIASGDITNMPLLEAVRKAQKPVILSTGASTHKEIFDAQQILGFPWLHALLHCTLSYPTQPEDVNLSAIFDLERQTEWRVLIGYSDHTMPDISPGVCFAAYAAGARVFEKHFTLTPNEPGNDHYHALDGEGMRELRATLDYAATIWGGGGKRVLDAELAAREGARRSLVALDAIPAGTPILPEMLTLKRPGGGLRALDGRWMATVDIPADTTVTREMVEVIPV